RKSNGRLPATAWVLLWPVLLGQYISLVYYRRRSTPWDRLTDRVWIGRKLSEKEAQGAVSAGVKTVLDLTGEFSAPRVFAAVEYQQMPILDLSAPTLAQLQQAASLIQNRAAEDVIYIHCKVGYSRTAAVTAAYLMTSGQA